MRILVLGVVPLLWGAWALFTMALQRQFLHRLKSNHPNVWISLGRPAAFNSIPLLRYARWFWKCGFDQTGDTELAYIGNRFYAASFILLAVSGVWVIAAWLFGYIEFR